MEHIKNIFKLFFSLSLGKKKKREEEEEDEPKKKKKKGAAKKLAKLMRKLMEIVIQYEDQDSRVLSDPFMKLPTRKELPDYYEVIRKPVDIAKILAKIEDGKVNLQYDLEHNLFKNVSNGLAFCDKCKFKRLNMASMI